jgi:hypothetical protein
MNDEYKMLWSKVITQIKYYQVMAQLSFHLCVFSWQWCSSDDIAIPSCIVGRGISYLGEYEMFPLYYFPFVIRHT